MTQTVGKGYAEALFLLAKEEQKEEQVWKELNEVADVMADNPQFITLLGVPTLSAPERVAILRRVIGDGEGITENFLCLLVEKRRFGKIADIRAAFNQMYFDEHGIEEVAVTSAVALDDAQRRALTETMRKKLGKEIRLIESVDPKLLGGMVVQYGDTCMDNSLRTRLQQFRQQS